MTSLSAIVSARLCLFRSVSVNISGVLPGLTHENSLKPASPVCEERSALIQETAAEVLSHVL